MRRLLPLLVAALAACQVNVEGAPCGAAARESADCPSGQGCGLDLRCSARAAATSCALRSPGEVRCEGNAVEEFSAASDAVCGEWVVRTRCEGGLVCGEKSGAPSCQCPEVTGTEISVVAPGPYDGEAFAPTGAAEPLECAFRSLTDGIRAAAAAGGGVVVARGGLAGSPVTFSQATGEDLPIDVPSGVTLSSDASTSGATYIVRLDDPAASAAVKLHAGAALSGFTIQNDAGDATRDAIALACDGASVPVRIDAVTVRGEGADADHQLGAGVKVNDACGVQATDVDISGIKRDAVAIDAKSLTVESAFVRGRIAQSGRGVYLKQGTLRLDSVLVAENRGVGVYATDLAGTRALDVTACRILRNDDTGIAAMNLMRLVISDTVIFGNSAATVWGGQTPSKVTRRCGGVVLSSKPPPPSETGEPTFRFERNRVYSNKGDQALVLGSLPSSWNLGASACDTADGLPAFNVFTCYDVSSAAVTPSYRGLVAIDAIAYASHSAWPTIFPSENDDWKSFGTGASVVVESSCSLTTPLDCSSPDAK